MSAWAHLPNAPHIDRILEHVAQYPLKWSAARDTAWSAAWNAARDTAWSAARNAAWDAAWSAARGSSWDAARGAIDALIAWDDCVYLLDLTPETVRGIARISASPAAFLLLPAVTALQPEGI